MWFSPKPKARYRWSLDDVQHLDELTTTFIKFLPSIQNIDDEIRESLTIKAQRNVANRISELLEQWSSEAA